MNLNNIPYIELVKLFDHPIFPKCTYTPEDVTILETSNGLRFRLYDMKYDLFKHQITIFINAYYLIAFESRFSNFCDLLYIINKNLNPSINYR